MVIISPKHLLQIEQYCLEQLPNEACGYLGGVGDTISTIIPMANSCHSTTEFAFEPTEQFDAIRDLRSQNISIIGVFHSHPNGKPKLSSKDIVHAEDKMIQMIVAINSSECTSKCFKVDSNKIISQELIVK